MVFYLRFLSSLLFILLTMATSIVYAKPTVLLIGLDGFKHDLLQQYDLPTLQKLANAGTTAKGLIPVMPSKTFPNFYAMATGLYPENNGVLENTTYDRELNRVFGMRDATSDYFEKEPIWIKAERNGIKSANMFWVGSEVAYDQQYASYWWKYDGRKPNRERIEQVLEWLDLPESERPNLITLYFSSLDSASHRFGVNSMQREHAAKSLDSQLEFLMSELDKREIADLNIMFVGDHGMTDLSPERVVYLDKIIDQPLLKLEQIDFTKPWVFSPQLAGEDRGNAIATFIFTDDINTSKKLYKKLLGAHTNMSVYQYPNFPQHYHLSHPTRAPDLLLIPDLGWLISKTTVPFSETYIASHGFDNQQPDMWAGFIGYGSQFNKNKVVDTFENIHIYCVAAEILSLDWRDRDCEPEKVAELLLD